MENSVEGGPERFPTREEVMGVISRYAESAVIGEELSDGQGLFFLEMYVAEEKEGDVTGYQYMRQGRFSGKGGTIETVIYEVYYIDGVPVGGGCKVAEYKPQTGEWEEIT